MLKVVDKFDYENKDPMTRESKKLNIKKMFIYTLWTDCGSLDHSLYISSI